MSDYIRRDAAINTALNMYHRCNGSLEDYRDMMIEALEVLPPPSQRVGSVEMRWIPVKTRPMTEEEIEYYAEHYGYDIEGDWAVMFDCPMPGDGQEVWICFKSGYVAEDVCDNDDGMIGLEGNGDWDDVVAWMPKVRPEPYKGEE